MLEEFEFTPAGSMIGITSKIGYYNFFFDVDQFIELSIFAPKSIVYKSDYFLGEVFYPDSITITEKIKFFTLGYSGRYLMGADTWDSFLLGITGGIQFAFESVTQEATDKGVNKLNEFKTRTFGGIFGISGIYNLTDEIAFSADLYYKAPYLLMNEINYSNSSLEPSASRGLQIVAGVLIYFE